MRVSENVRVYRLNDFVSWLITAHCFTWQRTKAEWLLWLWWNQRRNRTHDNYACRKGQIITIIITALLLFSFLMFMIIIKSPPFQTSWSLPFFLHSFLFVHHRCYFTFNNWHDDWLKDATSDCMTVLIIIFTVLLPKITRHLQVQNRTLNSIQLSRKQCTNTFSFHLLNSPVRLLGKSELIFRNLLILGL